MKLVLNRKTSLATATIGELLLNGVFQCYTLEDVVRDIGADGSGKVYGKTAIPAGTYPVTLTQSARFQRVLPLVNNVPHFEGIRIHPGNSSKDTDGCILVGVSRTDGDFINASRVAFDALFAKLQGVSNITLTVNDVA